MTLSISQHLTLQKYPFEQNKDIVLFCYQAINDFMSASKVIAKRIEINLYNDNAKRNFSFHSVSDFSKEFPDITPFDSFGVYIFFENEQGVITFNLHCTNLNENSLLIKFILSADNTFTAETLSKEFAVFFQQLISPNELNKPADTTPIQINLQGKVAFDAKEHPFMVICAAISALFALIGIIEYFS